MSKYIDAEAIKMGKYPIIVNDFTKGWNYAIDAIVENAPAADVQEVRYGRWMSSNPSAPMFGFDYCSICGRRRTSPNDYYCPNCGAKMDEVEE